MSEGCKLFTLQVISAKQEDLSKVTNHKYLPAEAKIKKSMTLYSY